MRIFPRLRRCRPGVALLALLLGSSRALVGQTGKVSVTIDGLSGDVKKNVELVLELNRQGHTKLTPDQVQRLYRKAEQDIGVGLQPFGYYHPRITHTLTRDGNDWKAHFIIDPGPVVKVRSVVIDVAGEGSTNGVFPELVKKFPLHRGDTLLHAKYQAGKLAFLTSASDSGFVKADYDTAVVLVDRTAESADITLKFDTGLRGQFGPVRFHQERDILDTSFLTTRIPFKQGQTLRHDKLLDFQTALADDPYWAHVEVTPGVDSMQGHEVPIDVDLVPRARHSNEFGLGYGTDTGPRGHVQSLWRYLNREGHNAEAKLDIGTIAQSVQLSYKIPAFGSPTGILSFDAGYDRDNPKTSTSHIGRVRANLLRHRFGWQENISLTYQRESFVVASDTGVSNLLFPTLSYDRTVSDSKVFPTRGYKAMIDVEGAHKGILSNTSFTQLHLTAKGIVSYSSRARLIARAEAGHTFTGDFPSLPASLRFFTGGDQTVRGFGYQTLGPLDSAGAVLGGSSLLVGSLETDYRVFQKYGVAAFTDVGNALTHFTLHGLEQSVGAGLRWISPIGLVRLDGAFAISRRGSPFRIHFSIGADL